MRHRITEEQQAVMDAIQRTIAMLGEADLSMVRMRSGVDV